MAAEFGFSGWAVEDGYTEFIDSVADEIDVIGKVTLDCISPDHIRNSLKHPNGFLVNTLRNNEEGQLRLHIWPAGRVDDLTPHSHPWHMASLVLAGTYVEYVPEVKLDDTSEHKLMGTVFNDDRQQIKNSYTGRNVRFDLGEPTIYKASSYHYLPAGEFHVTPLPKSRPIITLVRTGPQLFETPTYVLRQLNQELQLSNAPDRQHPTEEETQAVWDQLISLLEAR